VVGYKVMLSDREKTALDCIERPDLAGGGRSRHDLRNGKSPFDWTKTVTYLERIDSGALARRFGWLTDHVRAEMPDDMRERVSQFAAQEPQDRAGVLTQAQVQRYSTESGLRDIMIAEKEVVLTFLLQLERSTLDRMAFKGGTGLRKNVPLKSGPVTAIYLPIIRLSGSECTSTLHIYAALGIPL
jgi:hypothetical protein